MKTWLVTFAAYSETATAMIVDAPDAGTARQQALRMLLADDPGATWVDEERMEAIRAVDGARANTDAPH